MTQNISEEDQKKICALFFYLQDISLELQACSNILHQIKEKLEDSEENVLALEAVYNSSKHLKKRKTAG